ncbi:hypothetical protein V865_001751 [Kwoniella europaea PYCC6329]|uniref:GH16 domain-containing protein n=1 Tax=Kwoniella europaea PYCC6329 TaxID=1423913 RepID=A0AAX4KBD9_9TREE
MTYIYLSILLLPLSTQATPLHLTARKDPIPTVANIANEYGHNPCASPTDEAQSWLCEHPEISTAPVDTATVIQGNYGTVNPDTASSSSATASEVDGGPSEPVQPSTSTSDIAAVATWYSLPNGGSSAATRTVGVQPTQPTTPVSSVPVAPTESTYLSTSVIEDGYTITSSQPSEGTISSEPSSTIAEPSSAAAQSTSSTLSSNSTTSPPSECGCGYTLSENFNSAYYPKAKIIDFSTIADGTDVTSLGFSTSNGDKIGASSTVDPSSICVASSENVYISGGVLNIKVPAGQMTGGEIVFVEAVTGGVFSMEAKIDKTEGTCQSLFTYTKTEGTADELDMEMLGKNIFKPDDNGDTGIGLSNYAPDGSKDGEHADYTSDPTADFNRYTIGWFSDSNKFYYNDQQLKGPEPHLPVNPSSIIINNWSNGDPTFTAGPPAQDNILQIRKIEYYYQTEDHSIYPAMASGCSVDSACQVK